MRNKRLNRCEACGLSENLCVCSALPIVDACVKVVMLSHRAEFAKPTNTARLCARMLGAHAEILRSDGVELLQDAAERGAAETWVLFPSEDAVPLEQVKGRVGTLIVPDGTWAQARRIARRHPACGTLPKVRLTNPPGSGFRLRRYRDLSGLCTLEAVAYALGVLEGPTAQQQLLAAFAIWVERALLVRAGAHTSRTSSELALAPLSIAPSFGLALE